MPQPRCATRVLFAIPMPSDLTGNSNCKLNFKSSSSPVKGSRTGKSGRRGELGWLPGREERAGIPGGAAPICSHRDPGDSRHPKAAENLSSWRMFIASKSSCHWDCPRLGHLGLPSLPRPLCLLSFSLCRRTLQERTAKSLVPVERERNNPHPKPNRFKRIFSVGKWQQQPSPAAEDGSSRKTSSSLNIVFLWGKDNFKNTDCPGKEYLHGYFPSG